MSSANSIRPYERSGKPDKLHGKLFGKWLISRFFTNPDTGSEEEFGLFGQKDWSVVLAITATGKVLIVRQFKQGVEKIVDELPAGTADYKTESPETVMRRELKQETGHEASEMIHLGRHPIASRGSSTHFDTFLAIGCENVGPAAWDVREQIEHFEVELVDFLRLIYSGAINEPSAIAATMLSIPHLLRAGLITPEQLASAT